MESSCPAMSSSSNTLRNECFDRFCTENGRACGCKMADIGVMVAVATAKLALRARSRIKRKVAVASEESH